MRVSSFFTDQAFNQKDISAMSMVFEAVCSKLGLNGRSDETMVKVVAETIIKLVDSDVRDAQILHKMTLLEFNIVD